MYVCRWPTVKITCLAPLGSLTLGVLYVYFRERDLARHPPGRRFGVASLRTVGRGMDVEWWWTYKKGKRRKKKRLLKPTLRYCQGRFFSSGPAPGPATLPASPNRRLSPASEGPGRARDRTGPPGCVRPAAGARDGP